MLALVAICIGALALLCAGIYWRQESFIFFPRPNDAYLRLQWEPRRVEIQTRSSYIEAWWVENPRASTSRVLIYFGGNAEDVLYTLATAERHEARAVLASNYRGYGGTPGRPSEAALREDGLAVYDYVVAERGIPDEDIVVMGRSIGSGVATWIAARRPLRGVILVAPFDSLRAVAERHYPILPVRWLLRHAFASDELAPAIRAPALILAAAQDRIVPVQHAQRLFDLWGGEKKLHVLSGVGHNDIESSPEYDRLIDGFLAGELQGMRLE